MAKKNIFLGRENSQKKWYFPSENILIPPLSRCATVSLSQGSIGERNGHCPSYSPETGELPEGVRGGNIFMSLCVIREFYVILQENKNYRQL